MQKSRAKSEVIKYINGNLSVNWKKFRQNYEIYMKATEKDQKGSVIKANILLNLAGEEAIELYNTFDLKIEEKFNETKILEEFEKYCNPKKNIVYERYKLYKRDQREGEPFEQFITDIKKLSQTCKFQNLLEEMIRDRIVLGVNNINLQERLLRIENLDLQKTIDQCGSAELSKQQSQSLREKNIDVVKNKFKKQLQKKYKCEE